MEERSNIGDAHADAIILVISGDDSIQVVHQPSPSSVRLLLLTAFDIRLTAERDQSPRPSNLVACLVSNHRPRKQSWREIRLSSTVVHARPITLISVITFRMVWVRPECSHDLPMAAFSLAWLGRRVTHPPVDRSVDGRSISVTRNQNTRWPTIFPDIKV
jgi:hypothetical protein